MKTLDSIWTKIKFGDIVLFQECKNWDNSTKEFKTISKPKLVTIVGIDVWDMAFAVYYVNYKTFDCSGILKKGEIKIDSFGEWTNYWNILGHWKTIPNFKRLLKSYRKQIK